MFVIVPSVPIRQRAKGNATRVYAIKTRVCAFFIGLVVLKVGIIGGVETQVKTFEAVVEGLVEKQIS